MSILPVRSSACATNTPTLTDYTDAEVIRAALLPTWTTRGAGRYRDLSHLVAALRNPAACRLLAEDLHRHAHDDMGVTR